MKKLRIVLKVVMKYHHEVVIDIVAQKTVHHDPILVLQIMIDLPVAIQDPICEETHMKSNVTHA